MDSVFISEFAAVIRHVYENTDTDGECDAMRRLLSQFSALHFLDLMTGDVEVLITDCGDFATEVMRKIKERLKNSEESSENLSEEVCDTKAKLHEWDEEMSALKKSSESTKNTLQATIGKKDIEIWNLKSEVQRLNKNLAGTKLDKLLDPENSTISQRDRNKCKQYFLP
ncbi:MAG: hypothetical protein MMC33_007492 [Icmadophila ericetorum]|nr:hypothetical protein [Icmadophila ericetorum]